MWLQQKLRRDRFKAPGLPRLGKDVPRGLMLCLPFVDPAYYGIGPRMAPLKPAWIGSSVTMSNTYGGSGANVNGLGTGYAITWQTFQVNNPFSIEAMFWSGPSITDRTICGYNQSSDNSSGTFDKAIYFNASNQLVGYVYDGAPQTAVDSTTTFATNTIYHAVLTYDGTTLRLYVNGRQTATTAAASSFSSYSVPLYFGIGAGPRQKPLGYDLIASSCTMLLANVANSCWTAAEVLGRYLSPFGFLDYPDDDVFSAMFGRAATVRPRMIRMNF